MSDFLKSSGRRLRAGWFLPLALLTFPMCLDFDQFDVGDPPPAFDPGNPPVTSAVMCDIPKPVIEEGSDCVVDDAEEAMGMPLTYAAIALNQGETNTLVLDYSGTAQCSGQPKKIEFFGTFPDGLTVCLNCGTQIPAVYPGPTAVCIAKCKDLLNAGDALTPDEGVDAFCEANARPSTNFDKDACYEGFCTNGGTPDPSAVDPRRAQEPVAWIDQFGTDNSFGSNFLTDNSPTTGPNTEDFNAGAASAQLITAGDAWVEFGVPPEPGETTLSHVLGVRASCDDPAACPDTDHSLDDIGFSISLNSDGQVYVIESGPPLEVFGPFGAPYTGFDRFRVKIKDNHDGTATISYSRLVGPCAVGTACAEDEFHTSDGPAPQYPLRINASFREEGATIANVTVMRIIQ